MIKKLKAITLLQVLGKGAFGTVYLSQKDGKAGYLATKVIDRAIADKPSFYKYFQNELRILNILQHPNVVHLETVKKDDKYYYIVMEYVNGGSLGDCLKRYQSKYGKAFPEEIVQHLMRQIVDAIKFIHHKNIIHRDLKLENIMASFDNEKDIETCNMMKAKIKLIDFGFATQLIQNNNKVAKTVVGSPINMDPIILNELAKKGKKINQLGYDQKADIWSLGTICYEMLIGKPVFNSQTLDDLVYKVESGTYSVPTSVSKEIVAFLNGMLQYDGQNRLSADELSMQPFLIKRVNDFSRIDTNKVRKKIDSKGLNINVKKNKTIWAIFNENDEEKLSGINPQNITAPPPPQKPQKPIQVDKPKPNNQQNIYHKRNTENNIPKIKVDENKYKNYNKSKTGNNNVGVKVILDQPNNLHPQKYSNPLPNMNINNNNMNVNMNNMNINKNNMNVNMNNMNINKNNMNVNMNNMNINNNNMNVNMNNMNMMMNNMNMMMNNMNMNINQNMMAMMNQFSQPQKSPNIGYNQMFGKPTFAPSPSTFDKNIMANQIKIGGNQSNNIEIKNFMGNIKQNNIITNEINIGGNQNNNIEINNNMVSNQHNNIISNQIKIGGNQNNNININNVMGNNEVDININTCSNQ